MSPRKEYNEQIDTKNRIRLQKMEKEMPDFITDYYVGMNMTTSSRTRVSYAYDFMVFFRWMILTQKTEAQDIQDISLHDLEHIKARELESYMAYLENYDTEERGRQANDKLGVRRKISSVRSLYTYLYKHEMIETNPAVLLDLPKIQKKNIVRLEADEVAELMDNVETGEKLSKHQKSYHERTKTRDMAIVGLLLGTGIRVSECVGLDVRDVDLEERQIKVVRKGGKEDFVYFSDEVKELLETYINERNLNPENIGLNALFLTIQRGRMGVRSVEKLVKKYAQTVTTTKNITPHSLRRTYGTSLYNATGDLYLTAEVLGHESVETTKKHYAELDRDRKRGARDKVTLRSVNEPYKKI